MRTTLAAIAARFVEALGPHEARMLRVPERTNNQCSGPRPDVPVGRARGSKRSGTSATVSVIHIDGSASARGEAPPILAFPTPPAIKTALPPNVAAVVRR